MICQAVEQVNGYKKAPCRHFGCPATGVYIKQYTSSSENGLQILFRSADGLDAELLNQYIQYIGEKKAGMDGPIYIFFMPRARRVKRMHTAFCSYQERTRVSGNSLISQLKAFVSARAT